MNCFKLIFLHDLPTICCIYCAHVDEIDAWRDAYIVTMFSGQDALTALYVT